MSYVFHRFAEGSVRFDDYYVEVMEHLRSFEEPPGVLMNYCDQTYCSEMAVRRMGRHRKALQQVQLQGSFPDLTVVLDDMTMATYRYSM